MDPLVAAAAVSAFPATLAAIAALRASWHGRQNAKTLEQNGLTLKRVEHATNGEMNRKIREAVRDELIAHSSNTEEMRQLIDAMILNQHAMLDEDDAT